MSSDFRALARDAAARYPARDRYAKHFAYGKLTGDPVFEHIVSNSLVPAGSRVLDLGCGQGLVGVLLDAAGVAIEYRGVDLSMRDIERARAALGPRARVELGDVRDAELGKADVVIVLDVLHYIDPDAQASLLRRVRLALAPGGVLLLRVADASGGIRFRITEAIDLAATRLRGHRVARLHSVPLAERVRQLEAEGFSVEARPMSGGTPFANVLLSARYDSKAP